jgi:hypothetical protein
VTYSSAVMTWWARASFEKLPGRTTVELQRRQPVENRRAGIKRRDPTRVAGARGGVVTPGYDWLGQRVRLGSGAEERERGSTSPAFARRRMAGSHPCVTIARSRRRISTAANSMS